MLGVGASKKTYLDDIFSTTLYKSTGSAGTISTGINNATDGGMLWVKSRTDSSNHGIWDTERTNGYYLPVNSNDNGGNITAASGSSPFLRDGGFRWNSNHGWFNNNNSNYAAFNFRKAPGFFTIKQFTGTGSSQAISHDLGSMPGLIIVKLTSSSGGDWTVWQRDLGTEPELGQQKYLMLNQTNAAFGNAAKFSAAPTATTFSVGTSNDVNGNGNTYIAYIFAGGESTAATARSVDFDGTGDTLTLASSSDFNFGTGDFTFEGWLKPNNNTDFQIFLNWGSDNPSIGISNDNNSYIYYNSTVNTKIAGIAAVGQWTHYAISRSSGTTRLFLNGELKNSFSDSHNYGAQALSIGAYSNANFSWNGLISNVRIVKGTAVYTSSFKPPTEPLTNITNTKLLCCNDSSTTGSTVTPATISANGDPTASTDSGFDDPAGFVFGESGSENVIKTGSYVGSGSAGLEVNVGFEPQWIMFKNASATYNWYVLDVMRGIVSGGDDRILAANTTSAEWDSSYIDVTPTGFKLQTSHVLGNGSGNNYIYMCLRRPDGYVGKPVELGTDVFAMDTGNGSTTIPTFDSGFPVDFALMRKPASTENFYTASRLTQQKYMQTNTTGVEATANDFVLDSNVGWNKGSDSNSNYQSWMWKRHAGFDVVCWDGNSNANRVLNHSMNASPEMIWYKRRDATDYWGVGVNFTNSNFTFLQLNDTAAGSSISYTARFKSKPTSTSFEIGADSNINGTGGEYIAMLFASTDVSKVGSYTGNGGNQTITFGFQPRFVIIKSTAANTGWVVLDTIRGWTDSDSRLIRLDRNNAQDSSDSGIGYTTSTGMVLTGDGSGHTNSDPYNYIYYAHA